MMDLTIKELKHHKKEQLEYKIKLGDAYRDDDFVCAWQDGSPYRPHYISDAFRNAVKSLGYPKIRFHDLRHTHATMLLSKDVNPKIVSERLGHSTISITLDTYSHVLPNMQKEAVKNLMISFKMKLKNNSVVKIKNTSKIRLQQKIKKAPKGFKINWREYV